MPSVSQAITDDVSSTCSSASAGRRMSPDRTE